MRCAYLIPTANPALASECFAAWQSMGWDTFAVVEGDAEIANATGVFRQTEYPGWGESFNRLARVLNGRYDFLATGGDDITPDPTRDAATIGRELSEHFGGTFGVCQPSADRWAWDKDGTRSPIAYAPIIGADFARRWNCRMGAFWPSYFQWFSDDELCRVTTAADLLWERPDLMFYHDHVSRDGRQTPWYKAEKHPRWQGDADLFKARQAAGFPGHEPIPRSYDMLTAGRVLGRV